MSEYYKGELPELSEEEAKDFFDTYGEISPMCTNHQGMDGPGPFFESLYQAFKTRLMDELSDRLKAKKKSKPRICTYDEVDMKSALFMYELIVTKFPQTKEPNTEKWADDLRKMREIDKHSGEEIANLFTWAHNHKFWSSVILSPSKLRKQWGKLCANRQQEKENGPNQYI